MMSILSPTRDPGRSAFTLLETVAMMAALFVVTLLLAGIVKVQWPKWSSQEAVPAKSSSAKR